MNEEEFKECSVIAYPHEIRFLHIKGGRISYYVDRHISDYVNKLQEENKQLRDVLNKIKYEIERKIAFCSCEAKGHINPEKCNIAIHFLKKLLDELKEVR